MRLIAFGCSVTYGHGLIDCIVDKKYPGNYPSQHAWPQLLSNLLDINCINDGSPGASNKEILHKIQNFNLNSDDIVIILWSYTDRHCILSNNEEFDKIGAWMKTKLIKFYYKHLYNSYDSLIDFYIRANWAKFYLDKKNIKNYHLSVTSLNSKKVPDWNFVNFLPIDIQRIRDKHPKAGDKLHPGPLAQKEYAESIFNLIKQDTL